MNAGLSSKNDEGFTLIELLVALAVLVVAVAAFVPAVAFVVKANRENRVKITAGNIASSVIEEIRALPYDSIGTTGGNPAGVLPKESSITIDGITYLVETRISWSSAKSSLSGETNMVAYKNIQVTVRAPGAFSGAVGKMDEIHSAASRESEEVLVKNGHIMVTLRNSQDMPLEVVTAVHLSNEPPTPALNQDMRTGGDGSVLFGILEAGKYTVKVKVPDNLCAGPGHAVEDGWIVARNVEVNDYQTTNVVVYMDEQDKFCRMSVKLVDACDAGGAAIIAGGRITLSWRSGSSEINVIDDMEFSGEDFEDGVLPCGFFGPLWPVGEYSIIIAGVPGYAAYDMSLDSSQDPLLPDGSGWDGVMRSPGWTADLRVPLKAGVAQHFYLEDTKADFQNASLIEDLAVSDKSGGLLELGDSRTKIDLLGFIDSPAIDISASSSESGHPAYHISDKNNNTYWQEGRRDVESWVSWDFGADVAVAEVEILAREWGWGWSRVPKNFHLQCSADNLNWTNLLTNGMLADRTDTFQYFAVSVPQKARYFRFVATSRYDRRVAVNEMRISGTAGYATSGRRISNGVLFDERPAFASAPRFKISWTAEAGAGAYVRVFTAVTDNASRPDESRFAEVANGGYIPGIAEGSDIRGKYLWIMEMLGTGSIWTSPSLDRLVVDY